jgi:hypothetical protein
MWVSLASGMQDARKPGRTCDGAMIKMPTAPLRRSVAFYKWVIMQQPGLVAALLL